MHREAINKSLTCAALEFVQFSYCQESNSPPDIQILFTDLGGHAMSHNKENE